MNTETQRKIREWEAERDRNLRIHMIIKMSRALNDRKKSMLDFQRRCKKGEK